MTEEDMQTVTRPLGSFFLDDPAFTRYQKAIQKIGFKYSPDKAKPSREEAQADARRILELFFEAEATFSQGEIDKQAFVYSYLLAAGKGFLMRRFSLEEPRTVRRFVNALIGPAAGRIADGMRGKNSPPVPPAKAVAYVRNHIKDKDARARVSIAFSIGTLAGSFLLNAIYELFDLEKAAAKEPSETFRIPATYEIWKPLLLFFTSGKSPAYVPAFRKAPADRTPEEQEQVEEMIQKVFTIDTDYAGNEAVNRLSFEDPRGLGDLLAVPQKAGPLFSGDEVHSREVLYKAIQTELMSELGLRHFLAILLSFQKKGTTFVWRVNDHLASLGVNQHNRGGYDLADVKNAINTVKAFSKILFTVPSPYNKPGEYLTFPLAVVTGVVHDSDWFVKGVELIAPTWYQEAFREDAKQGIKYTLLLEKLLKEKNTTNRPNAAVALSVRFSLLWRINGGPVTIRIALLLNFVGPPTARLTGAKRLMALEASLDYLVEKGYMGSWEVSGEGKVPLQTATDADKTTVTLYPPAWLEEPIAAIAAVKQRKNELTQSKAGKGSWTGPKPKPKADPKKAKKTIESLINKGYSQHAIGQSIGVSQTMVHYWLTGKMEITEERFEKLKVLFEKAKEGKAG